MILQSFHLAVMACAGAHGYYEWRCQNDPRVDLEDSADEKVYGRFWNPSFMMASFHRLQNVAWPCR